MHGKLESTKQLSAGDEYRRRSCGDAVVRSATGDESKGMVRGSATQQTVAPAAAVGQAQDPQKKKHRWLFETLEVVRSVVNMLGCSWGLKWLLYKYGEIFRDFERNLQRLRDIFRDFETV